MKKLVKSFRSESWFTLIELLFFSLLATAPAVAIAGLLTAIEAITGD